ncbi:MAG: hypothetical protein OXF02_00585 [Simkaniaceae bacterium]|nr:hypothetical protein [Simkaniaceae bacterium]
MVCSGRGREIGKKIFTERCGCIERCRIKRSKKTMNPDLEEVVVEQPRLKSPSPESAPTAPTWWSLFGGWFAEPSGTTESVGESSFRWRKAWGEERKRYGWGLSRTQCPP